VIIPVYNRADFVAQAIESVLRQDYAPFELIVVDDGSTDETAAVVRSFPQTRYLHQNNQGVSAARNAGIASCRGEFLTFLDSDDLWMPTKLSVQVGFHQDHPEIGYSITQQVVFLEAGCSRPSWLRPVMLAGPQLAQIPSSLMVRRAALERIGNFSATLQFSEDVDWFLRASDSGIKMGVIPEPLLRRRIHNQNLSADVTKCDLGQLQAMKSSLERKRAKNIQPA